jgi:hypothetical protein
MGEYEYKVPSPNGTIFPAATLLAGKGAALQ